MRLRHCRTRNEFKEALAITLRLKRCCGDRCSEHPDSIDYAKMHDRRGVPHA